MQIVIDIPKSLYANLQKIQNGSIAAKRILECVRNGMSVMYYPQVEGITPTVVEPNTDCISRQYLIDKAVSWDKHFADGIRYVALTDILNAPPITPQPKIGHWIIKDSKEQGYDIAGIKTWYIQIMCDNCGFIKTAIEGHTGQYKFCPNCGAKMEVVKDNYEN